MPNSTEKAGIEASSSAATTVAVEQFRLLVESVKDYAIFMLDPKGVIATWNAGAARIKGYRADEIIGQHFSRFYPEEDVRAGKCDWELEVASKEGRFEDEGWRIRKDGSRFWANVVITALRDADGQLIGFAKVTRDLTDRRAAEEERLRVGQLARERIRALMALTERLTAAASVDEVGRAVTTNGAPLVRADTCTVHLLNDDGSQLELIAERGCAPGVIERIRRLPRGNPLYAIAAGTAEAAWVDDTAGHVAIPAMLHGFKAEERSARSFAYVPLVAESQAMGLLGLGFHEPRAFSDDEREFILMFARQSAQALARARRLALADRLSASLSTTLRSIGDAVIATDPLGNVTLMNGVAEALTGWTEAEGRGRPLTDVFHIVNEHTRAIVQSPVEKVIESDGIVGLANHTVLVARNGREIPIDDSGAPIRGDRGVIDGVVLVFRDVTERKQEEWRRRFLADATTVLSQSLDYELTISRVAELCVPHLADWCAVDLVVDGEPLPKRLAVAHVDPAKVELAKELNAKYPAQPDAPHGVPNVIRTGRSEIYAEIPDELLVAGSVDAEHLRIARELRLHSAMIIPLLAKGRAFGAISFVFAESGRSYTEDDRRVAEDLARRCANAIENARLYSSEQRARQGADIANRSKDEFLAVVSHELRTPLNAIMGWSKLLTRPDFDERRRHRALETIERNAVAMAQLIEDLLDMSRIISGKMRLELERVDLTTVIEAAADTVRPAAVAKSIELSTLLESSTPSIMGDAARLQQIVWNLLSNAVKFTPKGGRIHVLLRRVESSVEIEVTDTGAGISAAFLPSVFEAFRQEDASTSRSRGGLGLGLAITKQLVELHGGHILVQSQGEGLGSTFTVSLPVLAVGSQAQMLAERASRQFSSDSPFVRPPHIRGLRVLVVDDEDDARRLVAAVLEDCGCQVTTAQDVEHAMQSIADEVPHIVLSDIGMPGEDGFDFIRKLRALPRDRGGDVPAAALTAYARTEDRRRMLNAGYSFHLPKPVEPAELVAVVATLSRFVQRADTPD